jgi:hypothetical protein
MIFYSESHFLRLMTIYLANIEKIICFNVYTFFCYLYTPTPAHNQPLYKVLFNFCIENTIIILKRETFPIYRVFGNERYKSFCLLHRLEIVPRPKTCGKSLLYIGHFDIPWSQSIQMIF